MTVSTVKMNTYTGNKQKNHAIVSWVYMNNVFIENTWRAQYARIITW